MLVDREEKLKEIEVMRARIARLREQDAAVGSGEEKQARLKGMMDQLERLKILVDVNDPVIKKRYEDGEGETQYIQSLCHSFEVLWWCLVMVEPFTNEVLQVT